MRTPLLTAAIAVLLLAAPLAAQEDSTFDLPGEATPPPPPIAGLQTFVVDSYDHVDGPVDYPQDPPVGGPHHPVWQDCGFYDALVVPERVVHSQEHGAVWITYGPDLSQRELTLLQRLAERNDYVLVSPYPEQTEPVVVSAWGAQLRLEAATDPRLREFVRVYAGNGPELGAPCDGGSDETMPLSAAAASPTADPAASPVASPAA